MSLLTELAPAKVNLYLHVTGRRADGYHELDSLAVFPGAADRVTAAPADVLTLEIVGPFAAGLDAGPDNLVMRAATALAAAAGVAPSGRLVLEKHLPVASGIGGGSADAAAALRLLTRLWRVSLPDPAMRAVALQLGADVPVCLASRTARMGGIGERLGPAPALPPHGIVLVNPRVAVATPAVFRARTGPFTPPAELPHEWSGFDAMIVALGALHNALEEPAISLCPAVAEVLTWLRAQPACRLARMSGSGATCFGLFPDAATAEGVALAVPGGWWGWGGGFTDPPRNA